MMENKVNTNKKLVWTIIALALLNIATISTVFLRAYNDEPGMQDKEHHERHGRNPDRMKLFIKEKLDLSANQYAKFEVYDSVFKIQSKQCFSKMEQIRLSLLDELTSERPDTANLMSLTSELGQQHIILKKYLIEMYLSTRSICNKEQQKKLSMIFKNMITRDGMQPTMHFMKRKANGYQAPKPE